MVNQSTLRAYEVNKVIGLLKTSFKRVQGIRINYDNHPDLFKAFVYILTSRHVLFTQIADVLFYIEYKEYRALERNI